jgi:type IV pilus assembly protein PilC
MIDINTLNRGERPKKFDINRILKKEISLGRKSFRDKHKLNLYGELYMLLSAGLDLKTSLNIYHSQIKKKREKQVIQQIVDLIISGENLSDSIEKIGTFSKYEQYSIRIGEESGRLIEILKELSEYYREKISQRRKIISSLTYPMMVVFTAILVIIFMVQFIVPMFESVFSRFGSELPSLTRYVLKISKHINSNYGKIFLLITIIVSLCFVLRKNLKYRKYTSRYLLKIPLLGHLIRIVYLNKFCQSMSLMLSSGVPLLKSLNLSKSMIEYYPLEKALEKSISSILKGDLFNESLRGSLLFDSRFKAMIRLGEEVNRLPEIFSQMNNQYAEEIKTKTNVLNNILEPLLIIIIGGIVAVILIAMYLPMFSIGGQI